MKKISVYLNSIQFFHSIFALPFAFIAAVLARRNSVISILEWAFLIGAMVGARTWAMAINRLADHQFDKQNPRTANRALPKGLISFQNMSVLAGLGLTVFCVSSYLLNKEAFLLSPLIVLFLGGYSFAKRFTWACHFWLGLSLGLAPLAAWFALEGLPPFGLYLLALGVVFWVSGFDILYSTQDEDFDRNNRLHSIPARFGSLQSKSISACLHGLAAVLFVLFGLAFQLKAIYFLGCFAATSLLVFQHLWVRKKAFVFINPLFFSINGWVAISLFVFTSLSIIMEH